METFLIQALVIIIIWLFVLAYRNASDLRLLRKEIRPLFEAVERLRERLRELQSQVSTLQGGQESTPAQAVPIPAADVPPEPVPDVLQKAAPEEPPVAIPAATPLSIPLATPVVAHTAPDLRIHAPQPQTETRPPSEPPRRTRSPVPPPQTRERPSFDWEGLIGVKLFSWVAGIAMLVAAIFFLRYSIDKGWLRPPVQMAIGILVGLGLLVLCEGKAARRYRVTANAMDASAVAILFATFYAAHSLWHLIGPTLSFVFLVLVATVAVILSIRRDSLFIALLGLMGGFSTPALLSSGENQPITLFGYLLLLNGGLAWIAARKRWPLLTTLSLVFTTLYQWDWVLRFLTAGQLPLAMGIFLVFPILTFVALTLGRREKGSTGWASLYGRTVEMSATLPVLFAVYLASVAGYGIHYGLLFGFLFLLAVGLFAISLARRQEMLHLASAISTLVVFAAWFSNSYDGAAWPWILGFLALFVIFYLAAPLAAARLHHRFEGPGDHAAYAAPLLLAAFAVLNAIEPLAAAPGWIFGTLLLLLTAVAAYAVNFEKGGIFFLGSFFALAAEAVWSANYLTADRLLSGLMIYGIFGLLYIAVPIAAYRHRKTLRPESAGPALVLAGVALLFFIAHGGVAVWGLAVLLLILNLGLLLQGSASSRPRMTIAGIILSWAVLAYFWAHATLADILVPALVVVAALAVMAMAGTIWLGRRSAAEDRNFLRGGAFLGLVGHWFLLIVAAEPSLSVPPWPLLAVLFVLDLAVGLAVLYVRRAGLWIAALAGSALILMVWADVAEVAPWPAIAMLASGVLVLFGFLWLNVVSRARMVTAPYAHAAAMTVFLAQIVAIISADQTGAPGVSFLIPAHLLFLGALACLAWFRSEHRLIVFAVAPAAIAVCLWMVRHSGPEFWGSQLLFAGLVYMVFLLYPLALGRRAGLCLSPYLSAAVASVPFFFQAWYTMSASGYEDIIGILPVFQALPMTGLLWRLLRLDPPGKRAPGRLALMAGMALAFATAAIPLQFERQWITIAWALEGAALAWLYRKIPHRGLLYASSGLVIAVFVRLVFHATQLSDEPRSAMAIWNWHLYTYCIAAAAMIVAGWLFFRTDDRVIDMLPRASSLFPAGGAILLFLLLNIEIADCFSPGDRITFRLSATLAQDLTYTLGWAVFAVVLLGVGIAISSHAARVSSLGLLVITILKCFLHDLGRLGGLYRVVSFVGLALCLILVALALQKFVLSPRKEAG